MPSPKVAEQTALDILQDVRKLLESPRSWTKRAFARDASGRETGNYHDAACWCLLGAINKCARVASFADPHYFDAREHIKRAVVEIAGPGSPDVPTTTASFNDAPSTSHADILAVLDKAIDWAKSEKE